MITVFLALAAALIGIGAPAAQAQAAEGEQFVVRAKGSTGDEKFEVRAGGWLITTESVTTDWDSYSMTLPSGIDLGVVQVVFINDALRDGYDRTLFVDYVDFNGERFESEAPATKSTGNWAPDSRCVLANVQSEALHCNGFFQYAESNPGGGEGGIEFSVRAKGSTGDEQLEIRANGRLEATYSVTTEWASYPELFAPGTNIEDVQVAFVNDASGPSYDRNMYVDYVEFGGERFESEAPTTLGTGTWQQDSQCVAANLQTEILHCNGYFQYTNSDPGPGNETAFVVRAKGATGDERFEVRVRDQLVAEGTVTTEFASYSIPLQLNYNLEDTPASYGLEDITLWFVNDAAGESYDRTLYVDYIEFDGERFETESPSTRGTGTWKPDSRCVSSFAQSEVLDCNGYFQYAQYTPPGPLTLEDVNFTCQIHRANGFRVINELVELRWDDFGGNATYSVETITPSSTVERYELGSETRLVYLTSNNGERPRSLEISQSDMVIPLEIDSDFCPDPIDISVEVSANIDDNGDATVTWQEPPLASEVTGYVVEDLSGLYAPVATSDLTATLSEVSDGDPEGSYNIYVLTCYSFAETCQQFHQFAQPGNQQDN